MRQLCWRDFHHQVLAADPASRARDYRPRRDRWRARPQALEAWRKGRTGYPLVDAGCGSSLAEGYMHNRARMAVGLVPRQGPLPRLARSGPGTSADLLVDGEVANNVGNWQWVAGTGNDTRPNRVLNPMRQAGASTRTATYVRRYVPELEAVDGGAVHEPWRLEPA